MKFQNDIVDNQNYITPARYISGRIVEYDIKSANINILRKYRVIDNDYFLYLNNLPKYYREVDIGNHIRDDKNIYDILQKGIREHRHLLIDSNSIKQENIIRIANDAIFINTSYDLKVTKFDNIEFRIKSISNVMIRLLDLVLFINLDTYNIIVIGINDNLLPMHMDFLSFILEIVNSLERVDINSTIRKYNDFYKEYIETKLPISFYREFNSASLYKIKNSNFKISSPPDIENLDISYNLSILRDLWNIIFTKYREIIKR